MKLLKPKTIALFLKKKNWFIAEKFDIHDPFWICDYTRSQHTNPLRLIISKKNGISIRDFRHDEFQNLHLDSYYYWPQNLKELNNMYDLIVKIYSKFNVCFDVS